MRMKMWAFKNLLSNIRRNEQTFNFFHFLLSVIANLCDGQKIQHKTSV